MKFRPEANIWPLMSDTELRALAADIEANGQQLPIWLYAGDILDGRNRWLAITKYTRNIEPKTEKAITDSPISFVISHNEKRRHLNESQRGHASARALPFFEAEAKKRQVAGKGIDNSGGRGRRKTLGPIGPQVSHRARDDAALAFGTSPRNVQRGKLVVDKGSTKLNDAVSQGQLSLGKAEEIIRHNSSKQGQDAQVEAIAKSKMVSRAKGLTGEIEWYTPRNILDSVVDVIGSIELDPASSDAAQENVRASRYFTINSDGLTHPWEGRVFLNPPYAMPWIKLFSGKMVESWENGDITEGILLTNNATDTEWFHTTLGACSAICFTRGRISFLKATDGEVIEKLSPTCGQAFFYFGDNVPRFAEIFSAIGTIVIVHQSWRGAQVENAELEGAAE